MKKDAPIYVAGHTGLVGSALVRELTRQGYTNLLTKTHTELDLTNQAAVNNFFERFQPEYVLLAAAKVGGIGVNSDYPGDFFYVNLAIALNVIEAARQNGVKRLLNLGSSCIYPRLAEQPIKEEALLTGLLEPTNEAYALAKIAALKLCISYNKQFGTDFYSLMPTNLYGYGDNYDLCSSHVLPALIHRFHEAKTTGADKVTLWGDGCPLREFLFADDLAQCAVWLIQNFNASQVGDWINIGSGDEVTIGRLANTIREVVYADIPETMPQIKWDTTHPNGTPRKLLDCTRINQLGWQAQTPLRTGIELVYQDYLCHHA